MKALEKERGRRYETANGFAADVQRFLDDEAVVARPPSSGYKLRKFVKGNRGPVIAAAALLLVLCLGLLGTSIGMVWARMAEKKAATERESAIAASIAEAEARKAAEEQRGLAEERRQEADEQRELATDRAETIRENLY